MENLSGRSVSVFAPSLSAWPGGMAETGQPATRVLSKRVEKILPSAKQPDDGSACAELLSSEFCWG
jgi:hypothetical protein